METRWGLVAAGAALAGLVMVAAGCGSSEGDGGGGAAGSGGEGRPTIVVTTNILGDVVGELVGAQAEVVTIMPVGADPHEFQASAQEVDRLLEADALIVNGGGFEEGLLDVIESAHDAGVPTFEATSAVETIEWVGGGHDHEGETGDEADHEDEHQDEGVDPHFFTDPSRMAAVVRGLSVFLQDVVEGLDHEALAVAVDDYAAELEALDAEVEDLVAAVPVERRVLVTNHEVFGYFADRYGFEVVGAVIPGGTTVESASAGELVELAEIIEHEGVPAIFADTSSSSDLAVTLAAEVGGVNVVELYSESLGEEGSAGETYLGMVRANAFRISEALK